MSLGNVAIPDTVDSSWRPRADGTTQFVCHRRNEGPALMAPSPTSTPHHGPGSPQAPLTKQSLLTDL